MVYGIDPMHGHGCVMRTTASLRSLVRPAGAGRFAGVYGVVMPMLPSGWLDRFSAGPRYEQIKLPGGDERTPAEFRLQRAARMPEWSFVSGNSAR
ncbi:MAG: hypothetical protein R2839_03440 [Thermomicrobiales bacterium]